MAEKKTIELDVQSNIGSLKSQLREAQAEVAKMADQFGATSEQAANAAKRAAELKDRIGDAKNLTESFNPEAKFASFGQAINAASGAFTAFEGAMGLAGVESEALQKQLLKVQSAMAITQGLEALGGLKDAFTNVKAVAVDAFKSIKGAIGSTGIGLLVIALGTIVAYWDDIKAAVGGVSAEQKKLNAAASKAAEVERAKLTTLNNQDNVLKLQGKSEKEILKLKIGQYETVIATSEAEIKSKEVTAELEYKAAKRNYEITKNIIRGAIEFGAVGLRLLVTPIDMVLKTANKVSEALGFGKITALDLNSEITKLSKWGSEQASKFLFDPAQTKMDSQKDIKESKAALVVMRNELAGFKLQIKEIDKQASSDSVKNTENEEEEKARILQEYNEKLIAYKDAQEAERQSKITSAKEKELQDLDNHYEELYAKADAANQSDKDIIIAHQKDIAAIEEKYRLEELEKMKAAEAEALKLKLAAEAELQAKIEELDEVNFQNRLKKGMTEDEYQIELVRQKYFTLETLAEGNAEQLAIIEQAKADEIDAIEKKQLEKAKTTQKEKVDLMFKYAQTFSQAMGSLNNLLNVQDTERLKNVKKGSKEEDAIKRKMFERDKKLRIVQTIIDTASNVVNSVRNGGGIPTGIPFGIAAGAMGALQIAAINKAKYDGGDSSIQSPMGGGTGAGSVMSPSFNVVGNSGINQLAQLQQQPSRAYVVSGDVTSAQSLDRNRIENATLVQ
jgi:hypothetical protein